MRRRPPASFSGGSIILVGRLLFAGDVARIRYAVGSETIVAARGLKRLHMRCEPIFYAL
jgi:hypothetical protein